MHDLVHSGKVRCLGISDTPAWKAAQAQLLAQFRGWAPFVALQIEHSLIERTVRRRTHSDGDGARARRGTMVATRKRSAQW